MTDNPEQEKRKESKTRVIDKATLVGDRVNIYWTETTLVENFEYDENGKPILIGEEKNTIKHLHSGDYLPHQDLLDSFNALRKFFIEAYEFNDYDNFDKYQIIGVNYTGQQDNARVVITGQKRLEWNGQMTPAFPTVPLPLYDNDRFVGSKKLDTGTSRVNNELWAYMKGKKAASPQMNIEFSNGDSMNLRVLDDDEDTEEGKE